MAHSPIIAQPESKIRLDYGYNVEIDYLYVGTVNVCVASVPRQQCAVRVPVVAALRLPLISILTSFINKIYTLITHHILLLIYAWIKYFYFFPKTKNHASLMLHTVKDLGNS